MAATRITVAQRNRQRAFCWIGGPRLPVMMVKEEEQVRKLSHIACQAAWLGDGSDIGDVDIAKPFRPWAPPPPESPPAPVPAFESPAALQARGA